MPDVQAGSIYGAWGMLIVLYGVLGGAVIDAVGVRGCLLFSAAATGAARAALALTRSKGVALFCFFVPAAIGGALGVPVLTIGVKRCSPPHARGFAFSIFYVAMNLAALVAGLLRDVFLVHVPLTSKARPPPGLRAYMGLGAAAAALQIIVVAIFVKSGKWQEEEEEASASSPAATAATVTAAGAPAAAAGDGSVSAVNLLPRGATRSSVSFDGVSLANDDAASPSETSAAAAAAEETASASEQHRRKKRKSFSSLLEASWLAATSTLRAVAGPELYKFVAMSILTVNLKSIFRHLDATLPKFVARAFGCSAPAGSIYAINPAMIMTLVPVVGAALAWLEPFDAIHYGGYISAGSPLAIVAAPSLGGTAGFVALLSVGEAIWSPRWCVSRCFFSFVFFSFFRLFFSLTAATSRPFKKKKRFSDLSRSKGTTTQWRSPQTAARASSRPWRPLPYSSPSSPRGRCRARSSSASARATAPARARRRGRPARPPDLRLRPGTATAGPSGGSSPPSPSRRRSRSCSCSGGSGRGRRCRRRRRPLRGPSSSSPLPGGEEERTEEEEGAEVRPAQEEEELKARATRGCARSTAWSRLRGRVGEAPRR